eukprot:189627_1
MFTLSTIYEQPSTPLESKRMLFCATIDFTTFSLGTKILDRNELDHAKTFLSPCKTISKYAVSEYSNTKTNTRITIVSLSPTTLQKYINSTIVIPSLHRTRVIYLNKLQSNSGEYYLHICFSKK